MSKIDMKAVVPVISAWYSKINWTQVGAAATALIVSLGINIPDQDKAKILTGVTVVQAALTFVLRTWFNGSVAPTSLPPSSSVV